MGWPIGTVAIEVGGSVRRYVATSSEHSVAPYALIRGTFGNYRNQSRQRSGARVSPVEISHRSRLKVRGCELVGRPIEIRASSDRHDLQYRHPLAPISPA